MSGSAELQLRAEQLAQLGLETADDRLHNLLIYLSQEFREAAEQIAAVEGPGRHLSDPVPRDDET
jgi:hypothetical protein